MSKKKVIFIINPVSGVAKAGRIPPLIQTHLDTSIYEFEIVYTERPGHAEEISRTAADAGVFMVVAVGGDGSVNEAGSGLLHRETGLGIIPAGSGNGMANHLKIPLNTIKAIQLLNTGKFTQIDTMKINGQPAVGVAGIGFDAHVAHKFASFGKRGFSSYIKVTLSELIHYKPHSFNIQVNNEIHQHEAWLITMANSSQFGNKATINPWANLKDGLIEICVMKKFPIWKLPLLMFRLFNNNIDKSRYFKIYQTNTAILSGNTDLIGHIDGEAKILGEKIVAEINPASLKVMIL